MTAYPFSDEEITSILAYVKVESAKEIVEVTLEGGTGGEEVSEAGVSEGYLTAVLIILVVVLILILVTLVIVVRVLSNYIGKKQRS